MAREQQFNNGQRVVVDTIEQQNKYNTPDARRLRVFADPLNIPVAAEVPGISKLATALGTIKPALMEYGIEKKSEMIAEDINVGKVAAQTGGVASGEYQQWGFDSVKAVNDWTDWNQKVVQAYQEGFDKDSGDLEQFLKDQWETHAWKDKSDIYTNKFSPLAQKTMQNLRELQGKHVLEKREAEVGSEIVRMFKGDIEDVSKNGVPWDVGQYEMRRDGLRKLFPGKTNAEMDELVFEAVYQKATETLDPTLFQVFKKDHTDGTPGLYNIPKWREKVDQAFNRVLSAKNSAYDESEKRADKALKGAADTVERKALLGLITIQEMTDPDEREKALSDLLGTLKKASDSGLPISTGVLNTFRTFSAGVDKKEETKAQQDAYVKLRIKGASTREITSAFQSGSISLSGFNTLMSKHEAAVNAAAKGSKPVSSTKEFRTAIKDVRNWIGADSFNMTPDGKEARDRANTLEARMTDEVEDAIDAGKSPTEAVKLAKENAMKTMDELGWRSKTRIDSEKKLDNLELKKKDPVNYYLTNAQEYERDLKAKRLPPMTRRQQEQLLAEQARANRSKPTTNK
jgi:hypothetical protein